MAGIKIKVPKTPRSPFNKDRLASDRLKAQLERLEAEASNYLSQSSAKRRASKLLTEGQVADRIHQLTRKLHPHFAYEPARSLPFTNPILERHEEARAYAVPRREAVKTSTPRTGGQKTRAKAGQKGRKRG